MTIEELSGETLRLFRAGQKYFNVVDVEAVSRWGTPRLRVTAKDDWGTFNAEAEGLELTLLRVCYKSLRRRAFGLGRIA